MGTRALTIKACAKCGTTSLYLAVFKAIYGYDWDVYMAKRLKKRMARAVALGGDPSAVKRDHTIFIQAIHKWPPEPPGLLLIDANCLRDSEFGAPTTHFWVVRDPIDRYISTYHSKIKCCGNFHSAGSWTEPSDRLLTPNQLADNAVAPCFKDGGELQHRKRSALGGVIGHATSRSQRLLLATTPGNAANQNYPERNCLFFSEYVHHLSMAIASKNDELTDKLDPHYAPQRRWGNHEAPNQTVRFVATIKTMAKLLKSLDGHGIGPILINMSHHSPRSGWAPATIALQQLCMTALAEYRETGLPLSPRCSVTVKRPGITP